MPLKKGFYLYVILQISLLGRLAAQPSWTLDLFGKEKKPVEHENKTLRSEKTNKKFTKARRFFQNNVTHFNYYYNCNNRINLVLEKAKASYKDDYTQLLAYYPFTFDGTSGQKQDLDSTISSATAGILLHDLRSDWVDNMYLLIGKSYFYRKDFDSAITTFNFINYNLFPRKKGEDDTKVVGSATVDNENSKGSISIANQEKRNLLQRMTAIPPSRNDALIWLAKSLIEVDSYGEAAGLINTLQNDPNLPKRLQDDLAEVTGYLHFKQGSLDSAAAYLEKGIGSAETAADKARWYFLLAQLNEKNGSFEKAKEFYANSSRLTVDPLLDIYAQLNSAKMYVNSKDPKELAANIEKLLKMAKRDKFDSYRDIIYYSAAQLFLLQPDTASAVLHFNKSNKYNQSNIKFKNLSYLNLGEIAYSQRNYPLASAMYDSLQFSDTTFVENIVAVKERKDALAKIVGHVNAVQKEDSLQRIAAMAPAERDAFLKQLLKKLRKERGLKEEESSGGTRNNTFGQNQVVDLFSNAGKGEWYFHNTASKAAGFNEFKAKWGNRINIDNWRRKSAAEANIRVNNNAANYANSNTAAETPLTIESLATAIPTTPEKIDSSDKIIAANLISLGKIYQNDLLDYDMAIETYEDFVRRFGNTNKKDADAYLGLYYCYNKIGNSAQANKYKALLNSSFPKSRATQMVNNPEAFESTKQNKKATAIYENIYNLFIEGNFEAALQAKKSADSVYQNNYWTPQLLFIEAIYAVKQKNDSMALLQLNYIVNNFTNHPLKERATTMIDVVKRRAEIEAYLTKLEVKRVEEEKVIEPLANTPIATAPKVTQQQNSATLQPLKINPIIKNAPVIKQDSLKVVKPIAASQNYALEPALKHTVVMVLDKVDNLFSNELVIALDRYNRQNYYGQGIKALKDTLDADKRLVIISEFADAATALAYQNKLKRDARAEFSWLAPNKYSFVIATTNNLAVLQKTKKLEELKKLLNTLYPNQF